MADFKSFTQYKIFKPYQNLVAFTTTKETFQDTSPRFTGDKKTKFVNNRKQLAALIGVKQNNLVFPRQTHTNCVNEITKLPAKEFNETDALITDQPGICLCIQTADCVPLLLYDDENKAIAAVHAGWRGTVSGITGKAVEKMRDRFGTNTKNLVVSIGPSISPKVYEVGDEVIIAAQESLPNPDKSILKTSDGRFHFDLWEANRQILLTFGVHPENIEIAGECSFKNTDKYFSARRDGADTGRMVSGIMLV